MRSLFHRTLKAAIFQRNPPTTFLASQAGDLIFKCQVQPPGLWRTFPTHSGRPAATSFPTAAPSAVARGTGRPTATASLASPARPVSRSAYKFPLHARARAGARPPPSFGMPRPPGGVSPAAPARPRPQRPLPGPLPTARPRALPAERRGACCFLLGMLLGPP